MFKRFSTDARLEVKKLGGANIDDSAKKALSRSLWIAIEENAEFITADHIRRALAEQDV